MIITILLITLFLSILGHIFSLVTYVTRRSEKALNTFIKTTISNIIIAVACIILFMTKPHLLMDVDVGRLVWIMCGFVMVITVFIQIKILVRIYQRAQDESNYHLNFFGKKVLHSTVVSKIEMAIFFASMPFLLITGAYFVARLTNFFLYKHL